MGEAGARKHGLLTPAFSANRTVRQYTEDHYITAAAAYATRTADRGVAGMELVAWQKRVEERWSEVRFGPLNVQSVDGDLEFHVDVYPAGLNCGDVRVELYAQPWSAGAAICDEMRAEGQNPANPAAYVYAANTGNPPGRRFYAKGRRVSSAGDGPRRQ